MSDHPPLLNMPPTQGNAVPSPSACPPHNTGIGNAPAALARAVENLSTGDQALLRRMTPHDMPPPVFYRLILQHVPDAWNGPETERGWQAVLQGMAILALAGSVHAEGQSLGRVLGSLLSESAESRFWKLLEAEDETFFELLRHSLRMLAHERRAVDWNGIARLCLLSAGHSTRNDILRHMARDFCRIRQADPQSAKQGAEA